MANFYNSPNMNLVIPVPTVDPGPDWAMNLNASLTIIDGHNHSAGSGVLITPSGLNINTDLAFGVNNATTLRSVRFKPQSAPLALGTDIGCLYESGVDLYYNDGSGNQIRITQSGSVAGASGTITGLPSGTASAAYSAISGTFVFQQATATAANVDIATLIVRYPGSYPTPAGNYIAIEAPSSLASGYALTLPALPAQTNVMTLGTSGIISSTTWDQIGINMTATGANAVAATMTATGANAIAATMTATGANAVAATRTRATGSSTEGIGGIPNATGSATTTSTSFSTLATLTLTTSGRPIMIAMTPFNSTGQSNLFVSYNSTGSEITTNFQMQGFFTIKDGSSVIAFTSIGGFVVLNPPSTAGQSFSFVGPTSFSTVYFIGAGTYTFTLNFASTAAITGGNTITTGAIDFQFLAYEL